MKNHLRLLRLIDNEGHDIGDYDTPGELCIQGPTVITGYFENEAANVSSFVDGWMLTGDIAYCDSRTKKWILVDRKKVYNNSLNVSALLY